MLHVLIADQIEFLGLSLWLQNRLWACSGVTGHLLFRLKLWRFHSTPALLEHGAVAWEHGGPANLLSLRRGHSRNKFGSVLRHWNVLHPLNDWQEGVTSVVFSLEISLTIIKALALNIWHHAASTIQLFDWPCLWNVVMGVLHQFRLVLHVVYFHLAQRLLISNGLVFSIL